MRSEHLFATLRAWPTCRWRCASSAAANASDADANAAAIPSPIAENTTPSLPSTESRKIASCRASASFIAS